MHELTRGEIFRHKFHLDRHIVSPHGGRGENPKISLNFHIQHSVMAPQRCRGTVEHFCTTTNLLLINVIKIVSVFKRLNDDTVKAQTLPSKSVMDYKSNFLAPPSVYEILAHHTCHSDRGGP